MSRLRSTPLRLSVLMIAVFCVFISGGLATAYAVMHQTLGRDIEMRADQVIEELRALSGPEDRLERVADIAETADPRFLLIRLDYDGKTLGNLREQRLPKGIARQDDLDLPRRAADSYLVRTANLAPGRVTVLVDRNSLSELQETFVAILQFALLPALLLTSAIGFVVVRRTAARVDSIRSTLNALSSGKLNARVATPHPDTDLGDISRDLNRMAEAQEAATEALRQIGADIAHDLKTPIQRLAVRLERLQAAELQPTARDQLDEMQNETAAIIGTFQSMLQIAQLEGGQGRDSFGPVDLGALMQDMVEIYAPSVEETGAGLSCSVHGPLPIYGDRHLLSRLIANLIENAMRHAAGTDIRLTLHGRVLTLVDGGPGIPQDRRDDVLRRLVRLDASRNTPGSGLGLAMVKAIADLHGAQLVLGDADPGLSVTLHFPAKMPE